MCVTREIKLLLGRGGTRCDCCGVETLLAQAGLADLWGLS